MFKTVCGKEIGRDLNGSYLNISKEGIKLREGIVKSIIKLNNLNIILQYFDQDTIELNHEELNQIKIELK